MKEIMMDSAPAGTSVDKENYANRKLIRPTLPRGENHGNHGSHSVPVALPERRERMERHDRGERMDHRSDRGSIGGAAKKAAPPEQTNAENFYYQKQMQSRTPMVIVLRDGEKSTALSSGMTVTASRSTGRMASRT